jgi:hypothetical protein
MPSKARRWPVVKTINIRLEPDMAKYVHAERVKHGMTATAWLLALLRREMLRKKIVGTR